MILQAMVDYYERRRTLDPASVAPTGWEYREIAFFVDLGDDHARRAQMLGDPVCRHENRLRVALFSHTVLLLRAYFKE